IYLIIFIWIMLSNFIYSLWPRILANIFMTMMIVRTYIIYSKFIHYSQELSKMNIIIPERIEKLMGQYIENPFYTSNPTLEAISEALDVEKEDLRDYIYSELGTTLSAWTSEKRILYISQQLLKTDRMVSELALSCGYSNPSALNRAFKQRFGVTPSEFRAKHKD
ncbi:MAG: helix-turn-helix transcriptional regulator, partial [Prevotella sp.]|nr:helix-turn-helix transcriptional regulator [Prevotella sp.]